MRYPDEAELERWRQTSHKLYEAIGRLLCFIGYHDGVALGDRVPIGMIDYVRCRCPRCGLEYLDKQE